MSAKLGFIGIAVLSGVIVPAFAQDGRNPRGVNPTHYQCYTVETSNEPATLKVLRDQFGVSEQVKLGKAVMLCAPTGKNGVAPKDTITHYLCYEDLGVKPVNRKAVVINQLTKPAGLPLAIRAARMLCVPSLKRLQLQ